MAIPPYIGQVIVEATIIIGGLFVNRSNDAYRAQLKARNDTNQAQVQTQLEKISNEQKLLQNKYLQNYSLYATKKHEIYPQLWEKIFRAYSEALRLIGDLNQKFANRTESAIAQILRESGVSEHSVHTLWLRRDESGDAVIWRQHATDLYRKQLTKRFSKLAVDARNYYLLSQLYLPKYLQERVNKLTLQFIAISQQYHGIPQDVWGESRLIGSINELRDSLQQELAQESAESEVKPYDHHPAEGNSPSSPDSPPNR